MKRYFHCIFFLSLMVVPLMGIPYEQTEEYTQKQAILNERAVRFKAETGFTGDVGHSTRTMRLHTYRGNFSGIHFSAEADTIAFRQACESIVQKILPFSPANRMQLSMSRITKSVRGYTTNYYQQVNGYRVEGAGFIMITYEEGRKRFSIGDNTVELPDGDVSAIITPEEAERIAIVDKKDDRYRVSKVYDLCLSNEGSGTYYLAYFVVVSSVTDENLKEYSYWIDAQTGLIRKTCVTPRYESDVSVSVGGNYYGPTVDWNNINTQSDSLAIPETRVWIDNKWSQSNDIGIATLSDVIYSNQNAKLANMCFWMTIGNNADTLATNSFVPDPTVSDYYHVMFPDTSNGVAHYAPNTYVEALSQIDFLNRLFPSYFGNLIKISAACSMSSGGDYTPSTGAIRVKDARVHYVVRHELSHHFVHRVLGHMMGTVNQSAMDEVFANYFGGASKGDPIIPQIGTAWDISLPIHVSNLGLGTITESSYYQYNCGMSLASAWWSLRSDPEYSPTAVDNLLIAGLKRVSEEIIPNSAYRYKPRYFYNILMDLVDDDDAPYPLNQKQEAINEAYVSRGFHFTPQVISATEPNPTDGKDKNMFRIGDPVHVKVTNCPQNTPLTVYIVEDQDYTDGMNISALNTIICQVSGTSDNCGVWYSSTPVMTASTTGDYDILVDIGNNGVLHFAYIGANIRDGFDGLTGPGFRVYDDDITIVLMGSECNSSPCSK